VTIGSRLATVGVDVGALALGSLGATDDVPAVVEPGGGSLSYAQLDRLADDVARRLQQLGVPRGGRVGLYVRRSCDAVIAMLGALRADCAYVPVDPRAPVGRIAEIHADCDVQAAFVEERFAGHYRDALARLGRMDIALQCLNTVGLGRGIEDWALHGTGAEAVRVRGVVSPLDLACILYTSGTTGRPKGWMMTRRAVGAHVAWCYRLLSPTRDDVFANHAQFNFGMSLFDVFSSLGCGASLVLVPDEARQHGSRLVELIAQNRVSIWFSGPAILSLLAQTGDLRSQDLTALRAVAFAGEVFPFVQLNSLRRQLPHARYFNFYGSTETNVAAHYELPADVELDGPPPVGVPCEHYEGRLIGQDGNTVAAGSIGEFQLRGVGLSSGYWKQPAMTAEKIVEASDGRQPWFRTGDLMARLASGDLLYRGRLGRMVKLRGYRVEPGEIEARIYQHPLIKEVGVVSAEGASGLELIAHLSTSTGERVPVVELKEFCASTLPAYMIPHRFEFHASLPRTSSGKIDFQYLRQLAETRAQ
jgi:amino acid adenylation domain-containing protein